MFEAGLYYAVKQFERELAAFQEAQRRHAQQAWRTRDRAFIRKMQGRLNATAIASGVIEEKGSE